MGGAGVTVEARTVDRLETQMLAAREALHIAHAEMMLEGLRSGRAVYRPFWALIEADRSGDVEAYAIAIVQLARWYADAEQQAGLDPFVSLNERARDITTAMQHVIRQLPPDWTPAWRDGGERSAG